MAVEAVVSFAVETLGNLLTQKAVFLQGVKGEVEWVTIELKRMQGFLKDAAKKQSNSNSIRNWISDIREVALDAEDAIEKFVLNVENVQKSRGLLLRCACCPDRLNHLDKIGKEIESIRKRLEDIDRSRLSYGIQDVGGSSGNSSQIEVERRRRVEYWQQDRDVVGLENDVEALLLEILKERGGLSVASIIGMGGIGKSTLARKIYNHPKIPYRFDLCAWVVVSSEFTAEDIMKQLLVQLGISSKRLKLLVSVDDKLRRQQDLQKELHRTLTGKRYFIVVDDVWEATHWESLRTSFPDEDNKASRLLLTSRNQEIQECSQFVHHMRLLNTDQSWELLMKKAFIHNTGSKCPEELQNIAKDILKWCDGLPLAISVVGGVLQKKTPCKSEWEKVVREMKSHMGKNNGIKAIVSAILELSYHNLPPELKACFLCLGFFKEDAIIEAKNLVHIWVAQGLVAQEEVGEEETMEDVATDYLDQLISRNMVQVQSMKYDVVKACSMHDLVRDLSRRKAEEEINLEILKADDGDPHNSSRKPRHRAIYYSGIWFDSYTNQHQYLRSLFIIGYSGDGIPSSYWKSFELLKVLHLTIGLKVLPKAIGALTGLRYFRMIYWGDDSKLPRSWGKLTNLQVLDILGGHGTIIIDKVILKMESLRHLYAYISSLSKDVPLGNMKKLQTLGFLPLKNSSVWQIQGMAGVTTLWIDMSKMSDASELFTHLCSLGNLVSLTLQHSRILLNTDCLSALHGITQLEMEDFDAMKRLPKSFPPKLSYLTLGTMQLIEDPMPVLERLPELLHLELKRAYKGEKMVITRDGFPRLKVLSLQGMSIGNIQVKKGGMPELKKLFIHDCPHLNIKNLPKLLKSAITDG